MDNRFASAEGRRKAGVLAYALAALSVLPVIGVVIGAASITWGLNTRKGRGKRVAALAALGIAVSVAISVACYKYVNDFGIRERIARWDTFDEIRKGLARNALNQLVPAIEFYKVRFGSYPETLEQLQAAQRENQTLMTLDPMTVRLGSFPQNFYYRRVDPDHYYLRSVGPDGVPFTDDDIVPDYEPAPGGKLGLLKRPPKQI